MRSLAVPFFALLFATAGCATSDPLPADVGEAKKVLAGIAPSGTPVAEAKRRLEQHGFKCRAVPAAGRQPARLSSYVAGSGWPVKRQWAISFEVTDGKVGEPSVHTDLLGP